MKCILQSVFLIIVKLSITSLVSLDGGCSTMDGNKVKFNEVVTIKDKFQAKCVEEGVGRFYLKHTNCINNGQKYKSGEKYVENEYVFQCKIEADGGITLNIVACQPKGKQTKNFGDQWTEGGFVYKCEKLENGSGMNIVGCANEDGKVLKFGETTLHGKGRDRFVYKCQRKDKEVLFSSIGCSIASKSGETVVLDLNCARNVDKILVQCIKRGATEGVETKRGGKRESFVNMC